MLHWHIMPHHGYPQGEDDLWQTAIPVMVNHVAAHTLSATDLLLAVCTQERPTHSIQWIPDAIRLLQGANALDWSRLLRRVAQQAQSLRMHHALAYLHEVWHVPIPMAVLQQLATMAVQPFEQWEAQLYQQAPSTSTKVGLLWAEYQRRQWWAQQVGLGHDKVSLSQYLQHRFQLDYPWQIPLHLGKACLRRFSWIGNHDSTNHNSTMGQKASE